MPDRTDLYSILADLRSAGVHQVRASFSGSNDEGDVYGVALVTGAESEELAWDDPRREALQDAIESELPSGWEQARGGAGTATLHVATGRVTYTFEPGWGDEYSDEDEWDDEGGYSDEPGWGGGYRYLDENW
jgi:hypothetical protein